VTLARDLVGATPADALRAAVGDARRASGSSGAPVLAVAAERLSEAFDPLEVFRAASGFVRAAFIQPDRRFALVAVGAEAAWRPAGSSPLAEAADFRRALPPAVVAGDRPPIALPVMLGGFAFQPGPRAPHWSKFGDGLLILPRALFAVLDGTCWRIDARLVGETEAFAAARISESSRVAAVADRMATKAEWAGAVLRVLERIADGEAEKVVLAREAQLEDSRPPEDALAVLVERFPSCTSFAFDLAGPCFLGATPERLAAVRDGVAEVMALAGTTRRGATEAEDAELAARLLTDRKERAEHAYVVNAIRDAIGPVLLEASVDPEPHVVRLPHLQHLRTFVRGPMRPGRTLLDLAARLHPTPAVGGIPRSAAAAIIRDAEGFDRGWYAGPLGWVDARGDGEFVVALRSALLVPGERARLFAGCGIVARSDPEREYEESELKLEAMRSALEWRSTSP